MTTKELKKLLQEAEQTAKETGKITDLLIYNDLLGFDKLRKLMTLAEEFKEKATEENIQKIMDKYSYNDNGGV